MREAAVERYLCRRIASYKWRCLKVRAVGRRGFPDRLITGSCVDKLLVELKTKGGRRSKSQTREHARLRREGWTVLVIWTKTQVDEHFPAIKKKTPFCEKCGGLGYLLLFDLGVPSGKTPCDQCGHHGR